VGAETIFAQIAAEELGMQVEHVSVSYGDSQTTPYTINSSYGSRTTALGGLAVRAAAFEAKRVRVWLAHGIAPHQMSHRAGATRLGFAKPHLYRSPLAVRAGGVHVEVVR
jgi:CO/xanthine dehydrogenase Mo-binding subunit